MSANKPALVVIDIQKEYTTPGRSFYLETAGPSLRTAKSVLEHARAQGWDVAHVQHLQAGSSIFNSKSEFSGFVSGFEPAAGESHFVKSDFSSYSSPEFAGWMKDRLSRDVIVIGYGSTMCCISTIIDGYHRSQKFTFVKDASCARKTANFDEQSTHAYATDIISTFAKISSATEIMS